MDTKELLGERVRELRKKRKLTQEKLAELAGVDISYLGNIERGTENPTVATLDKLAAALSVRLSQILTFEHTLRGDKALRRRLNQILDKCSENELQVILKVVSAIKE
jgi:transcriptional regulator with XRE-family HTH domain